MPDKRKYTNRAEYLKRAVSERRRRLKKMVTEYKGGKCVICGYSKYAGAFDLHHAKDSKKNSVYLQGGLTRSWDKIKKKRINVF